MTHLEHLLTKFTQEGLATEERLQVLHTDEPPKVFKEIAKEMLCGCFLIESGKHQVRICPTKVELYYHEEAGEIKDAIVYHRNDEKHPERALFPMGMLHNHYSGIDVAFEFDSPVGICRASALVRGFRTIDGANDSVLEITNPDNRSTYFPKALLGQFSVFDGFSIKWCDTDKSAEWQDVFSTRRIGMTNRERSAQEVKEADRCWNFCLTMKDEYTDVVYLSEWLNDEKEGHPAFFKRLTDAFSEAGIKYRVLTKEETDDYWVRDFMPIQLSDGEFVKYKYNPDYLRNHAKYKGLITNSYRACKRWGIPYKETSIVIDGGNVVLCGDCVVMTDKVFTENKKDPSDEEFRKQLSDVFGGRRIVFIPWTPPATDDPQSNEDVYGHADGFIKYAGGDRILMSSHRMEHADEASAIVKVLTDNGFKVTEMDFSSVGEGGLNFDLNWAYINFLQVGQCIFMPSFCGAKENDIARRYIQQAFPTCSIIPIEMEEVVAEGGALHCLTWNIKE